MLIFRGGAGYRTRVQKSVERRIYVRSSTVVACRDQRRTPQGSPGTSGPVASIAVWCHRLSYQVSVPRDLTPRPLRHEGERSTDEVIVGVCVLAGGYGQPANSGTHLRLLDPCRIQFAPGRSAPPYDLVVGPSKDPLDALPFLRTEVALLGRLPLVGGANSVLEVFQDRAESSIVSSGRNSRHGLLVAPQHAVRKWVFGYSSSVPRTAAARPTRHITAAPAVRALRRVGLVRFHHPHVERPIDEADSAGVPRSRACAARGAP